jgi:hypothetical protein
MLIDRVAGPGYFLLISELAIARYYDGSSLRDLAGVTGDTEIRVIGHLHQLLIGGYSLWQHLRYCWHGCLLTRQ